jgi:hypothetical protein
MRYIDEAGELESIRQAHPGEPVILRRQAAEPWLLWPPGRNAPVAVPNGGPPAPRDVERT